MVVLPDMTDAADAPMVAEKILRALTKTFELPGIAEAVAIGVSIGIALFPTDGRTAETLLNLADGAMYLAKKTGRCRFIAVGSRDRVSQTEDQSL